MKICIWYERIQDFVRVGGMGGSCPPPRQVEHDFKHARIYACIWLYIALMVARIVACAAYLSAWWIQEGPI